MAEVDLPIAKSGKETVEKIYQKKTPIEHVLLRPDTYIGSVELQEQEMWVYDGEEVGLTSRKVNFVPGLYKIFDEILVNAADNKQRDPSMDVLRVEINPDENKISVYNNGKGIPVVEHKDEKMYVPTMIFGHLLTSSNYDDDEKRVTGGRHGYGAKLCNIFSTKFIVETSSKEYKLAFKQTWTKNMSKTTDPKIVPATGDDYTKITFYPDLPKFNMEKLDNDIIAIFSRRVYDIAGSTKGGVKVYLNGKRLKVNSFKNYVELYLEKVKNENGEPIKFAYDDCGQRWQIAVAPSDKGFQQVSFVNSIATTKGGRHVEHVLDQIVPKLNEVVKKKNKAKVDIKPHMIKSNIWLFVNCLIENPSFDSQTKENMTLQMKKFGSKCTPSDKFFNALAKSSIIDGIMVQAMAKADKIKESTGAAGKKKQSLTVEKLEDANLAGRANSLDCTLILTEGDSAKSLVMSGFEIVGKDKYGVFPLKGKLLNVREASHKQIVESKEIQNLLKIIGLDYRKKYDNDADLKSLRYGKIMIMTDQDQDGSHIKGLLINFIHHNWPNLMRRAFIEQFITPIVRARKGEQVKSFYSLPELEEWKQNTPNWKSWHIKYYKGLGSSDKFEGKEYFSDLNRHRIIFKYQGDEDDHSLVLAFSKKMIEQRKDWLTNFMEDRKRRKDLGLPETHLYSQKTNQITYKDFVNKELIHFSNLDNERSIPALMDGLKPSQRKVLYACFRRNLKSEIKVSQLGGVASEIACYHHGEASLHATIIGLAQNFVGSNNINLLHPAGLFGSRLTGGKDAAAPRYLHTRLSTITRKIFPHEDDPLLSYLWDDNSKVEPEYYVPIVPMVLVNGAEGIGTGWSTKIPNYNPREIVANLKRMLDGQEPEPMNPWFKGFTGQIDKVDSHRYLVSGTISRLEEYEFEITELPVRTWTDNYKDSILTPMKNGTEKSPPLIEDYTTHCTDVSVRYVVTLNPQQLKKAEEQGLYKYFKLQSLISTSSMVLFDSKGCLRRYDSPEDILKEFYEVRLEYYKKRKEYKKGLLQAEKAKLTNKVRFILEKNDGSLKMENVKKRDMIETLKARGYDSDPIKAWKEKCNIDEELTDQPETSEAVISTEAYDYTYLLSMTMQSMLREHVDELIAEKNKKQAEYDLLNQTSIETLWQMDLDAFSKELDAVEEKEKEHYDRILQQALLRKTPDKTKSPSKARKKSSGVDVSQCKPTPWAEKIPLQIDHELYRKKDSVKKPKVKKEEADVEDESKVEEDDSDMFDIDDRPLSERIGISPVLIDSSRKSSQKSDTPSTTPKTSKAKAPKSTEKKSSVNGSKSKAKGNSAKDKKKKRNPWSDSEQDNDSPEELDAFSDEDDFETLSPVKRISTTPAKTSARSLSNSVSNRNGDSHTSVKATVSKSSIELDSDDDLMNTPAKAPPAKTSEDLFDNLFRSKPSSTDSEKGETTTTSPLPSQYSRAVSPEPLLINDDVEGSSFSKKESKTPSTAKSNSKTKETKKPREKKPSAKKRKPRSSEDEDFDVTPKKKKAKSPAKRKDSGSGSDTEKVDADFCYVSNFVSSTRMGRNKKPINYKCDMSSDDSNA